MGQQKHQNDGWKPPIIKTEAVSDQGVDALLLEIENHRSFLGRSPAGRELQRKKEKVEQELAEMVKNRLILEVFSGLRKSGEFEDAVEAILNGKTDPYTACDRLIPSKPGTESP